jgi:flavin reductase (DIM6/NTAB) family NADH-FMN oxidoreductase RutF
MELSWNDRDTRQFLTNVGLITTDGRCGPNVMTAEWTHHVSYSPSLIAINVRGDAATAEDQNILCSLGGRYTGKELDKISLFKELDIIFYKAKSIKTLMIRGAAMNAECKLVKQEGLGDHIMFVGEVTEISADDNIKPLVYHNGRYWRLDDNNKIPRPSQELLDKVEEIAKKYVKV